MLSMSITVICVQLILAAPYGGTQTTRFVTVAHSTCNTRTIIYTLMDCTLHGSFVTVAVHTRPRRYIYTCSAFVCSESPYTSIKTSVTQLCLENVYRQTELANVDTVI